MARYRERGIAIWRTDSGGMLRVALRNDGVEVAALRQIEPRYWRRTD